MKRELSRRWHTRLAQVGVAFVFGTVVLHGFAPAQESEGIFDRVFGRRTGAYERQAEPVLAAFQSVVASARQSLVQVFNGDEAVAWGAIVSADGYIVTKRSDLRDEIQVLLPNGDRRPARLIADHSDLDLALLKCEASGLRPVEWSTEDVAPVGTFVVTPGDGPLPLAIGVVSVASRKIPRAAVASRAYLGVRSEFVDDELRLAEVVGGTPAAEAGLSVGDVLLEVNGVPMASQFSLQEVLGPLLPDDKITLKVGRDDTTLDIEVTLTSRTLLERGGNWFRRQQTDRLEGQLSQRRGSFESAFQHDSVLNPSDCGGPILGLDGRALGINIARARRVASYAVPANEVREFLAEALVEELVSEPRAWNDRLESVAAEFAQLAEELELLKRVHTLEQQVEALTASLTDPEAAKRSELQQSLDDARAMLNRAKTELERGARSAATGQ